MTLGGKYVASMDYGFGSDLVRADERILPRCFPVDMFDVMPDITDEMHHYRTGFHAFLRLDDARDWLAHCTHGCHPRDAARYVVCIVQLQDITGSGYEDNPICRGDGEGTRESEVIVGTIIEILHEVK
jgi:hypothetical protein